MARSRTPKAKAEVSGAAMHDPGRFEGRSGPQKTRPIGEPYTTMTQPQKAAWAEFQRDLPWLRSSHRALLRLACILTARMDDGEFGVSAMHALSAVLSKLGATPVDECKVNLLVPPEDDPNDRFFGSTH